MREYITSKGNFINYAASGKITINDVLGNKVSCDNKLELNDLYKIYNLKVCAVKNKERNDFINPKHHYSLLLYDVKQYCLSQKISLFLKILRQIEDISFQLVSGTIIDEQIVSVFLQINELRVKIREGHINHIEYEKIILHLSNQNKNLTSGLLVKDEIVRLGDLIRTELCHSEYCINNTLVSLGDLLKLENKKFNFKNGEERLCYGFYADSASWSFIDSIKSISTALDALAKLIKFLIDINFNKTGKKKNVLFADLRHFKSWGNSFSSIDEETISNYLNQLMMLLKFRHHVTHNSALFHSQNSAFVGFATPSVNGLAIGYSDLLLWDYKDSEFCSSQRNIGFFSQNNNAVEFATAGLENAVLLTEKLLKFARLSVLKKCKYAQLNKLTLVDYNLNQKVYCEDYSINELEKEIIV